MEWMYNGAVFTPEQIGTAFGFVYLIICKSNGKTYVGKKFFTKATYKQVKGKRKKARKGSDWESYYGSNKILLKDVQTLGPEMFERHILHLCQSRSECSYWETYEIFTRHALLGVNFYNDWVSAKITRTHMASSMYAQQLKVNTHTIQPSSRTET